MESGPLGIWRLYVKPTCPGNRTKWYENFEQFPWSWLVISGSWSFRFHPPWLVPSSRTYLLSANSHTPCIRPQAIYSQVRPSSPTFVTHSPPHGAGRHIWLTSYHTWSSHVSHANLDCISHDTARVQEPSGLQHAGMCSHFYIVVDRCITSDPMVDIWSSSLLTEPLLRTGILEQSRAYPVVVHWYPYSSSSSSSDPSSRYFFGWTNGWWAISLVPATSHGLDHGPWYCMPRASSLTAFWIQAVSKSI